MQGARLEGNYHIITGQVNPAKNIYRCVEESGMKVLDLVLEPLASSESVLTEEEKEADGAKGPRRQPQGIRGLLAKHHDPPRV